MRFIIEVAASLWGGKGGGKREGGALFATSHVLHRIERAGIVDGRMYTSPAARAERRRPPALL